MDNKARLNRGSKNYTNSQDYISMLDELLKKNKGGSTLMASDTASNKAYQIAGTPIRTPDLQGGLSASPLPEITPYPTPRYPQLPEIPMPEDVYQEPGQVSPEQFGSIEEYIQYLDEVDQMRQSGEIVGPRFRANPSRPQIAQPAPQINESGAPMPDVNAGSRQLQQNIAQLISMGYSPDVARIMAISPTLAQATPENTQKLKQEEAALTKDIARTKLINSQKTDTDRYVSMLPEPTIPTGQAREDFTSDINARMRKAAGLPEVLGTITPFPKPVEAAEPQVQSPVDSKPQQNIFDTFRNSVGNTIGNVSRKVEDTIEGATAKAGQGVQSLKNTYQNIADDTSNVFKKMELSNIGGKRVVGEDSATAPDLSSPNLVNQKPTNDIRDNFFKGGGAEIYSNFLKPGIDAAYKGALNLNLFKDEFFDDANNVANTFANTYLAKPATEKYRTSIFNRFPIMPGGDSPTVRKTAKGRYEDGSEWSVDYDDVNPIYYENQYNQSVRSSVPDVLKSDYRWEAPMTPKTQAPRSVAPYQTLSTGSQYSAPTTYSGKPQNQLAPMTPKNLYMTPVSANIPQSRGYSVPQQSVNIPRSTGYSVPQRSSAPSGGGYSAPSRNMTPVSANIPRSMPAPAPKPAPAPVRYTPAPKAAPARSTPAPAPKPVAKAAPQSNAFRTVINWFRR